MKKTETDLLRGHTDTIVLSILDRRDSYGYEIHRHIVEKTGSMFELKEATLYSSYRRLEAGNFIESYWGDESQGGRRKYYRITELGKRLYKKNRGDWEKTRRLLSMFIEEGGEQEDE